VVNAIAVNPPAGSKTPLYGRAVAGNNGVFQLRLPAAGLYRLCVSDSGLYLGPCAWSKHSPPNQFAAAVKTDGRVRLVLSKGRRISVRLIGTEQTLANETGRRIPPVQVKLTDATGSFAREIPIWQRSRNYLDFAAIVPVDPSVRISVGSSKLQMAGPNGARLLTGGQPSNFAVPEPASGRVPAQRMASAGPLDSVLVLNLTGRLPRFESIWRWPYWRVQ